MLLLISLLASFHVAPVISTNPALDCVASALPKPSLFGASIQSISAIRANSSTTPPSSVNLCNVSISYTHPGQNDTINVQLLLPDSWNGRFQGVGGGGWSTSGQPAAMISAVSQGYAAVTTDGGHSSTATTDSWGLISPGNVNLFLLQDFASVALYDMTVLGKQLTEAYYGKSIRKSYWNGCSTGGRQGLMLAQRYPNAYDGILAQAPAINWAEFIPAEFWPQHVMREANYFPSQCEFNAITAAVVDACDGLDGLKDGVIGLVGLCNFDPFSVVGQPYSCSDTNGYISNVTAAIVKAIWQGPRDTHGRFQWFGLTQGAPFDGLANTTRLSNGSWAGVPFAISNDWHRIFLAKNTTFDPYTLTRAEWDAKFHLSKNVYTSIIGTADPDLSQFKKSGGKMITWHGTADRLIFFNGTVNYYERVLALDRNAKDFYRFYSAPGVGHCSGGLGAAPTDPLAQLVSWVEDAKVPETISANRTVNGTVWKQELCLYPLYSRYNGGDPAKASSFTCV